MPDAKKRKTPLHIHVSSQWRMLVRSLQVLPVFDRIQLGVITGIPFGSVSRIVSELENEGYIEPVLQSGKPVKAVYSDGQLKRNPDLRGKTLNYGKGNERGARQYTKAKSFSEFITRWRAAVIASEKKKKKAEEQLSWG